MQPNALTMRQAVVWLVLPDERNDQGDEISLERLQYVHAFVYKLKHVLKSVNNYSMEYTNGHQVGNIQTKLLQFRTRLIQMPQAC